MEGEHIEGQPGRRFPLKRTILGGLAGAAVVGAIALAAEANGNRTSVTKAAPSYTDNRETRVRKIEFSPTTLRAQMALKKLGYYGGELDGKKGSGTTAAIESLQGACQLPQTGHFDSRTRACAAGMLALKSGSREKEAKRESNTDDHEGLLGIGLDFVGNVVNAGGGGIKKVARKF